MFTKQDIIHTYSTKQAVEDGFLVLVDTEASKEAGIRYPVYLTQGVWDRYVDLPRDCDMHQDISGRLWDILWMFRCEAQRSGSQSIISFSFYCVLGGGSSWERNERSGQTHEHRKVTLKAVIQARDFDDPSPAIFIMKPHED